MYPDPDGVRAVGEARRLLTLQCRWSVRVHPSRYLGSVLGQHWGSCRQRLLSKETLLRPAHDSYGLASVRADCEVAAERRQSRLMGGITGTFGNEGAQVVGGSR